MILRRRGRKKHEPLDAWRRRLIAETELALFIGLRFPKRVRRIPTIEVGRGRFHPSFALRFWSETLGVDEDELARLNRPGRSDAKMPPTREANG